MNADSITNVLGESKPITERFEDGSYTCPWCKYATFGPCQNPACEANPYATRERVLADRERRAERAREAAERARAYALRAERFEAEQRRESERWDEVRAEAARREACLICLNKSNWRYGTPKYVRHRDPGHHEVTR